MAAGMTPAWHSRQDDAYNWHRLGVTTQCREQATAVMTDLFTCAGAAWVKALLGWQQE
jgi:hypothetical protein